MTYPQRQHIKQLSQMAITAKDEKTFSQLADQNMVESRKKVNMSLSASRVDKRPKVLARNGKDSLTTVRLN